MTYDNIIAKYVFCTPTWDSELKIVRIHTVAQLSMKIVFLIKFTNLSCKGCLFFWEIVMLHWLFLLPRRLKELLFLSLSLCYPDGWFLGGKFGFDSIIISNGTQFLMNLINWFSFTDHIKCGFSIPPPFFSW